jgi:ankyrin repeat protein
MDAQGYTLMHYAVTYNNCEALKTLLRGGVGVDERSRLGQTPLTIVCNYGFMESAAILVEYGADVNA